MVEKTRKIGLDAIDTASWGMHLCQFYDTRLDLLDILVPYFKAGLESNEFCVWVTSAYPNERAAEKALRKVLPNFSQYLESGQIEIIPHTEWYLKDGVFDSQRVLNAWISKLDKAVDSGYDGMRVSGDTGWPEQVDFKSFIEYEEEVNNTIGNYSMLAICTYSLGKCGVHEVIDVMSKHQAVLIKQAGNWVLIKPSESQEMTWQTLPRQRLTSLQERFVRLGIDGVEDDEIYELFMGLGPEVRRCVEKLGSLRSVLEASPEELQRLGVSSAIIFQIRFLREIPRKILREKIVNKPFSSSSQEVFDYLYYSMQGLKNEVFKVIYLDNRGQIIDTVDLFEGTLDSIPIRPRDIVESAIKYKATAVIFVHNHPAGDPSPSKSDKHLTRDLVIIGNVLQINVVDHIIIGEDRYFSFADEGLIQKYQDDFLNYKIRGLLHSLSDLPKTHGYYVTTDTD